MIYRFVTCSWDNSVKYWDLETGEKLVNEFNLTLFFNTLLFFIDFSNLVGEFS